LEGNNEFGYQTMTSYKYKYLYYIGCAIILIVLIIRAFSNPDTGLIDNIIIVSMIMLVIYHYGPYLLPLLVTKSKKLYNNFLNF
jgi:hypothetical protein